MKRFLALCLFLAATFCSAQNPVFFQSSFSNLPQAAAPTFSPAAGAISSGTTVSISTATSGCSSHIFWNFTGTNLSAGTNSTTSTAITSASTLFAQVIGCPGFSNSAIASAAYTVSSIAVVNKTTVTGTFGSNTTGPLSLGFTVATGDFLLVQTAGICPNVNGALAGSSSMNQAASINTNESLRAFFLPNAGGTSTVTVNASGGCNDSAVESVTVIEFSGMSPTASIVNTAQTGTSASLPWSTTSYTATAGDLLVAGEADQSSGGGPSTAIGALSLVSSFSGGDNNAQMTEALLGTTAGSFVGSGTCTGGCGGAATFDWYIVGFK